MTIYDMTKKWGLIVKNETEDNFPMIEGIFADDHVDLLLHLERLITENKEIMLEHILNNTEEEDIEYANDLRANAKASVLDWKISGYEMTTKCEALGWGEIKIYKVIN